MVNDLDDSPAKWFDKAAAQILFANPLIDDNTFKNYLHKLCLDRQECRNISERPVNELFTRINVNLRVYGMEIKSVALKKDNISYYYHGIANTEDDIVAKDMASSYEPLELKYFTSLCKVLVQHKFINTHEATTKVNSKTSVNEHFVKVSIPDNWAESRVKSLIKRFEDDKWIQRDDRGRIELGLRTYLELSTYIQELITILDEEGDGEDDGNEEDEDEDEQDDRSDSQKNSNKKARNSTSSKIINRMRSSDLPQVLIY